jgi:hypothetical protein
MGITSGKGEKRLLKVDHPAVVAREAAFPVVGAPAAPRRATPDDPSHERHTPA